MSVYRRRDVWYIDFYFRGRRIQKAVGPNKRLAETVLQKKLIEIKEGKFFDIKKEQRVKFDDFTKEYLELHARNKRSYHSDIDTIKRLSEHFSGLYLHEITPLLVEKFKTERAKKVSPATVNRGLACLKCIFNCAIKWDRFDGVNPVTKVKLFKENNKRVRFLEKEEIGNLIVNCPPHLKPIVVTAIHTGLRKSEILHLQWRDIDFRRNIIYVTQSKSGERREIPMNEIVRTEIIKVRKHPDSNFIFCNNEGQPWADIKKSFLSTLKKCGILEFRFHDLRHTFASHLVMNGVDLNTVRELLGHKTLDMTLRYSHLSPDHKKRATDLLGQRLGRKEAKDSDNLVTSARFSEFEEKEGRFKFLTQQFTEFFMRRIPAKGFPWPVI